MSFESAAKYKEHMPTVLQAEVAAVFAERIAVRTEQGVFYLKSAGHEFSLGQTFDFEIERISLMEDALEARFIGAEFESVERVEQDPFIRMPRFVSGVVIETKDGQKRVRVDYAGIPRGQTKAPQSLPADDDYQVGEVIVFERSVDAEETVQWNEKERVGMLGDTKAEIRALAYRSNIDEEFSPEAQAELAVMEARHEAMGDKAYIEAEARTYRDDRGERRTDGKLFETMEEYVHGEGRLDLRDRDDIDIFTIDPESARDYDDAISFRETMRNGEPVYEVGVHIADVTHFVELGSALEKDARNRQFTRYLKQLTVTMLPEFLANTACSLEPDKDRLSFSTIFIFSADGELVDEPWFGKCLIKSKDRLTYQEGDEILDDTDSERHDQMTKLHSITQKMRAARNDRGSIQFDGGPEIDPVFDEDTGKATELKAKHRTESSLMIEDLMLAANEAQAKYLNEQTNGEQAVPFRAQEAPAISDLGYQLGFLLGRYDEIAAYPEFEELEDIVDLCKLALATVDEFEDDEVAVHQKYLEEGHAARAIELLQSVANETEDRQLEQAIDNVLMRLLQRARYTTSAELHMSLAVQPYLQATSPIRRHIDMIVQYLMNEQLRERTGVSKVSAVSHAVVEESVTRANDALIRAKRAERDATKIATLDIIEKSLQENGSAVYSGENATVKSVDRKGVHVALRLPGRNAFTFTMPWDEIDGVYQNEEGKYMCRVDDKRNLVTDGSKRKTKEISAFAFFRSPAKGLRTLDLKVTEVDRLNRRPKAEYRGNKVIWDR